MRSARPTFRSTAALAVAAVLGTVSLALAPASRAATGDGGPTDPNVSFVGRWDVSNPAAYVPRWAGAYLTTGFTGTTVKLRQRRTIDLYYSIDGGPFRSLTNVSGTVNLTPTPLAADNHTLRVSYRTVAGSYTGDAVFQGLVLDSGARTVPVPVSPRVVEFVGDSITVGQTSSQVALTSYGWLVGEQLGLRHTQIAQGGACLRELTAAQSTRGVACVGLERRFTKIGAADGAAEWDFSRYRTDEVVINIGTNDTSHGVSTADFRAGYLNLLTTVRAQYPNAAILALRTFVGRYATQTQAAVQALTAAGDRNVFYVDTTGWLDSSGLNDSVHPNDAGHRAIAARLAPIVSSHLGAGTSTATSPVPTTPVPTSPTAAGCTTAYQLTGARSAGFVGAPQAAALPKVTVWMAGDSTMMNASSCPIGWGNRFAPYFTGDVSVVNSAVGGRSIQTWMHDPNVTSTKGTDGECVISPVTYSSRWNAMLNPSTGMKAGDYLFIQFGINDGDSTCPRHVGSARYKQLLGVMTKAALDRGAHPVLVTPVAAITCSGSTAVGNRGFLTETAAVAAAYGVPLIDLHKLSVALYNTLHLCPNNGDYTQGAVGAFFCNDHTHFELAGARQIAGLVVSALRDQRIGLGAYLATDPLPAPTTTPSTTAGSPAATTPAQATSGRREIRAASYPTRGPGKERQS